MALELIIGIIIIVMAVVLTAAVLLQSSKDDHLSGAIAGGAETFFGKSKGKTIDKKLNTLTIILSAIFVVIVIVLYMVQPGRGKVDYGDVDTSGDNAVVTTTAPSDTGEPATEDKTESGNTDSGENTDGETEE